MIASMGAVGLGSFGSSNSRPAELVDEELTPEPSPDRLVFDGPLPVIDAARPHIATITTDQGDIEIELAADAPQAINSFAFLAGAGFYDGQVFYYVSKELGAVAGDPTCTADNERTCSGVGGPGYSLPLEESKGLHKQWAVVAPFVTEGGQDVHGSQFRILYKDDPRLDGKETVFGEVVKGQDILDGLSDCSVVEGKPCAPPLTIEKVIVKPA